MIRLIRTIQCPSHPILRFTHYLTSVNGTYGTYPPNEKWGVGSKRGANAKRLAAAKDVSWGPYTSPDVYDIAFSYRDFESEVSFLLEAYSLHSKQPLHHYLDVGCGPARHAMLLAQVAGINCIGIDTSEEMIEYAHQRAQECRISKHVWFMQEDMANPQGFKGIINDGPINLAAIMIGTLSHCLTNESALQCFTNIAEVLQSEGILIIELAHPSNLFGGDFVNGSDFADAWEISEDGSVDFARDNSIADPDLPDENWDIEEDNDAKANSMKRVLVEYGREGDVFDCSTQILTRTVGMSLFDPAGNLVSSNVSQVRQRQFTMQEINFLAEASGFKVAATYGDLDIKIPLMSEDAHRMVVVLQKK